MTDQPIVGYQAKGTIFCDLCGIRRDKGGFIVRKPIEGRFCSAAHARIKIEQLTGGDKK